MSNDLDARIVKLVSAILASAVCTACAASVTRVRQTENEPTAVPISTTLASSFPPGDPRALCAVYRDRVALDPTGPKLRDVSLETPGSPFSQDVTAEAREGGRIVCQIAWERTRSSSTFMAAPPCCPQADAEGLPCPPPSPQQIGIERTKTETVVLEADGTVVSSHLAWNVWQEMPEVHTCGRRPEGFAGRRARSSTQEGAFLAEMAELEAASIGAFERLARELEALGAPWALVDRARAARADEIRHARVVRSLARARGAEPRPLRARRLRARPALEVALENAVEGCVFETFGAAVATLQAERAAEGDVREAFAQIAIDERAHASLAADVDGFFTTILDAPSRDAVAAAKQDARRRLLASRALVSETTRASLGLPSEAEHLALARAVASLV
ncbi:MAG: ferritin-like domain-containing protein [Polyangiaceae bacterium]